ncbi:hypothetical protein GCM10023196_051800 [Actinoallomurus vinaceus]|uniref:SMODS and SLOG-associating 2TM effector domain-containing protein n=1 Tax=Actinoallomurus vinaceus TaxID=1080074 RepID=A0ABP8UG43_9ACTN
MRETTYFIHPPDPKITLHRGHVPGRAERARDLASDLLGSWTFLGAVLVLVTVAATLTDLHVRDTNAVTTLDLIMPGLTLATASLVLMAIRHAVRAADERARSHLAAARRIEAAGGEILGELDQINSGLARLAARIETTRRTMAAEEARLGCSTCGCSSSRTTPE